MKTKTILVAMMALVLFAGTADITNASSITMINETNALVMLDFSVTASGGTYEVPLAASSTVGYLDRVDLVGYTVDDALVSDANGIVLSSQLINGNRYTIEQDEIGLFTLLAIVTFETAPEKNVEASLTKIPYWVNGERTTVHETTLAQLDSAVVADK